MRDYQLGSVWGRGMNGISTRRSDAGIPIDRYRMRVFHAFRVGEIPIG